ncbi:DUF6156 family protein [Methylococcus sp. EFPC2]|uniref:DUF6156 family protein n=1 Tax=Methylococcus sp. EFPC2 TaxID=2812648 RepID=UPI0019676CC4|nr:DUF6156 family protein [Methylococcus sp. EFPC2]QSA95876.1 hypothetical protein JWZ97_11565 [Methylococcus sp. EFPC2]
MTAELPGLLRYFLSYTGIKLPLKLLNELEPAQIENRNTYFRGYFDEKSRLTGLQKMVYGEVEMQHRYKYRDDDTLLWAEIADAEGEVTQLDFGPDGRPQTAA